MDKYWRESEPTRNGRGLEGVPEQEEVETFLTWPSPCRKFLREDSVEGVLS